MITYIICLKDYEKSMIGANQIKEKMKKWGHQVTLFDGINGITEGIFRLEKENRKIDKDVFALHENYRKLIKKPGVIGCFYSHYELWKISYETQQEIIIFEDDVELKRDYIPVTYNDVLILSVDFNVSRSDEDHIFKQEHLRPLLILENDPFAINYISNSIPGASGYAIKPLGAKKLLERYSNTYNAADFCINSTVCDIKIHSCLMGETLNHKSLTRNMM